MYKVKVILKNGKTIRRKISKKEEAILAKIIETVKLAFREGENAYISIDGIIIKVADMSAIQIKE